MQLIKKRASCIMFESQQLLMILTCRGRYLEEYRYSMRRSLMSALMASAARPLEAASRSRAAWKHRK